MSRTCRIQTPSAVRLLWPGQPSKHSCWQSRAPISVEERALFLSTLADGRALNVKNSGAPVDMQPEASVLTWSVFVIPKGAPNKDAAMKYIDYAIGAGPQAAFSEKIPYAAVAAPQTRADIRSPPRRG